MTEIYQFYFSHSIQHSILSPKYLYWPHDKGRKFFRVNICLYISLDRTITAELTNNLSACNGDR